MVSGSDYSCLDYAIHNDSGETSVMWCTGLEDQAYWVKGEGKFVTIVATVNPTAKAGSTIDISIGAINRTGNKDIIFGYVDYAKNENISYAVKTGTGVITVGGEAETTTVTTTEKPDETTTSFVGGGLEPTLLGDVTVNGEVDIRDVTLMNQ